MTDITELVKRLRAEVERLQNYYTELMTTNAAIREGKVSDEERKPTSLKWRKSIYPDLAKVEDWLNKKGYTGEAGAVHVAMDEILELGIESARLIRENKVAFEAVGGVVKANDKLKEENARLREALKPFADGADCYTETATDEYPVDYGHFFLGHLRAARAALKGK